MRLKDLVVRRCPVSALLFALLAALGSGCQRDHAVPELPDDPTEYTPVAVSETTVHWQGEMAGEVTQDTVILQARLTVDGRVHLFDVEGRPGIGAFALSTRRDLREAFRTRWIAATPDGDYIVKVKVTGLEPGTRYYYRLLSRGGNENEPEAGPTGTFTTLDARQVAREVSFVIVTGMNAFAFRFKSPAEHKELGFPALEAIVSQEPDFLVATGDNVYYDTPYIGRAKSGDSMRAKWHRQFATPRFAALFQRIPVYWQKDDHDYRYNDADPYGALEPSHELGAGVFLEQVPVAPPEDEKAVTYRTHRIGELLQIWLLEGRDYRDSNIEPPGPDKTMWGAVQKNWLEKTLLASDAVFKILISPTPMIGPDDKLTGAQGGILARLVGSAPIGQEGDDRKRDNHTNPHGFKDEAEAFFAWLAEKGFLERNFYILCGDRHWQYHSVRPDGFEEFSSGALVDGNARLGRKPGDEMSTDPDALISQPYTQEEKSGGFLKVTASPASGEQPATLRFEFFDENGALLYRTEKAAQATPAGTRSTQGPLLPHGERPAARLSTSSVSRWHSGETMARRTPRLVTKKGRTLSDSFFL
jgi:alkaline phosphatase/alkaline phosphatase D